MALRPPPSLKVGRGSTKRFLGGLRLRLHRPAGARRLNIHIYGGLQADQADRIQFFFFKGSGPHRDLPSSPTRRFSDLPPIALLASRHTTAPSSHFFAVSSAILKLASQSDSKQTT